MSHQQANEQVNVYGIQIPSSFDAILQIFRPGGINNVAGTPNFLLSFDPDTYQASWKDIQQGGLESATFMLRKAYEDVTDIVFGNWIVYAQGGGYLNTNVSAGATSIQVNKLAATNLTDASGNPVLNIQTGDNILISDGVNTEQFVATVSGTSDPYTITLGAAPGVNQTSLLNNYSAASTKICRLVYQGIIQRRVRNTDMANTFQIQCLGMFNRYANVDGSSVAEATDGGALVQDILSSYSSTLPEIIYNAANCVSSSTPVTTNAKDQRISEILGSILTQESSQSGVNSGTGGTSVVPRTLNFLNAGDPTQTTLFKNATAPLNIVSSDTTIATAVQGNAVGSDVQVIVTAVGKGNCTITVTDANAKTATFAVYVANAPMQTSGLVYAIGVGSDRQVYHKIIPTDGTPTKTLDITQPSALGDVLAPLETTDMDGSNLINAAIVRGGSDANGNRLRIIVQDTYSQAVLDAWYEGVLDNSQITTEAELAKWAAGQMAVLAYPTTAAKLNLTATSMRITTQDLIQVNGFSDGSSLLINPLEIQYMVDAANQVATAQITLGVLRPQVKAIAKEYASEHAIRETYNFPPTNTEAGVVSGLSFTQGAGFNFTIAGGSVTYGGEQYTVAAYPGTAPANATSYWGVQIAEGTAFIVQMPSAQSASLQSAHNVYSISYRGGPAVASSTFVGIPLYKITTSSTAIVGYSQIFPDSGISLQNFNPNLSSPTVSGITVANASTPTTLSSDVSATLTVTNVPQDGSAFALAYYFHQNGTSTWIPFGEVAFPGIPNPVASITMPAFVYGQLQNGISYDFAVGFVGIAGYGNLTTIKTAFVANSIVVTVPYLIGTTSPTPTVTSITLSNGTSANGVAAAVRLQFTVTNQPTDGSLRRLSVWFRVHGASAWTFYTSQGVPGLPNPSASQAYDITLADLTNGQNYDFAATFENAQGQDSATPGIIYSNWTAQALNLPTSALPKIPSGTTVSVSAVTINSYAGAAGAAQTANITFTPTVTPPAGDNRPFSQWGAGYQYWGKVNDTGVSDGDTNSANYIALGNNGALTSGSPMTDTFGPLGAGHGWQIALQPIDQQNNGGPLAIICVTTAQTIGTPTLGDFSQAPTITANSATSRTVSRGALQFFSVTFTQSDFGSASPFSKPANLDHIELVVTVESNTDSTTYVPINPAAPASFTGTSATYTKLVHAPLGSSVSIGVRYVGANGKPGAVTALSNCQSIGDPGGDFVDPTDPSGGIKHGRAPLPVRSTINDTADDFGAYTKFGVLHRLHIDTNGQPGGTNLLYNPTFANGLTGWTTRSSGTGTTAWSTNSYGGGHAFTTGTLDAGSFTMQQQQVSVSASQIMVISGILEATYLGTAVSSMVDVVDAGNATTLGSFTWQTGGSAQQPFAVKINTGTFTSVLVRVYAINNGASNGQAAVIGCYKLQLEYGTQPSPWVDHNSNALLTTIVNHDGTSLKTTDWLPESGTNKYAAEHGADITGNHTANDTSKVNGVAAATISQGASRANAAINSSNQVNYANSSAEYQAQFKSGTGRAKASSVFNDVPNMLTSMLSDVGVSYSSTITSVSIWITNARGSGLPVWTYSDGSGTIAPSASACGSSGTPYDSLTGMSSGQTAYFVIHYNISTGQFVTDYKSTTPPSDSQMAAATADGSLLVVLASNTSSAGFVASAGGGGIIGGGGGHQTFK